MDNKEYKLVEYCFTVSFIGTVRGMWYDRLGARREWFEKKKFIFNNDLERSDSSVKAIRYFSKGQLEVEAHPFKENGVLCLFENGIIHEPYIPTEEDILAQDWHTCELYPSLCQTFKSQDHWK